MPLNSVADVASLAGVEERQTISSNSATRHNSALPTSAHIARRQFDRQVQRHFQEPITKLRPHQNSSLDASAPLRPPVTITVLRLPEMRNGVSRINTAGRLQFSGESGP